VNQKKRDGGSAYVEEETMATSKDDRREGRMKEVLSIEKKPSEREREREREKRERTNKVNKKFVYMINSTRYQYRIL
jgi:hypothetical protein